MAGALSMDESQYNMKMFDSNEFVMDVSYHQLMPTFEIKNEPFIPETAHGPYLQIIEEPKQRGFRFRYECEGPSHGGLPGASSERNRRTYPTVKLCNYVGVARVEVQLVTHTDPPRVHAHSLVGKQCNDNGTCSIDVGPSDLTAQFSNLGILHVTKRGVVEVLTKRLKKEKKRAKQPGYHFSETEEQAIVREAKELGKNMDLNIVRLKFTAYLKDSNGGFTRALKPVVSNPIYDSKSPNASNLKISRMDKTCGSVIGGDEIFLLCDKVQKDDIEIRFYEEEDEGGWEAYGDFSPTDVHKQYAIVFRTPPYHKEISRPVTVFLQLKRKKGGDCSEPKQFTYFPQYQDKEEVMRKKMKNLPQQYDNWRGPHGGAGGLGRGAGGFGGPGGGGGGGGGIYGAGFSFSPLDTITHYGGSCSGFAGGTLMTESALQPEKAQERQQQQQQHETPTSLTAKQQLFQIASALQKQSTAAATHSAKALLNYCCTGDVRYLLAMQRQLCGVQDENGDTPLHLAIIHQQPAVANKLIQTVINTPQFKFINKFNHLSQTPLHLAVITQQPKLVEILLKVGADPALLDRDGRTAVHLAAHSGDEVILRVLINMLGERHSHLLNTADFSGLYPLHLAVRKGGERCLRVLVEAGAKINMPEQKSGCTALHLAVKENLFKVTCILITELKADINACTFGGNTPLHLAASLGSPPLCSMLVAAGADKQLENDEPLFCSSSSSDEEDQDVRRDSVEGLDEQVLEMHIQDMSISSERRRINPRKRPAVGHTPFDLANCQKVRDLLDSPKPSHILPKKTKKSTEDVNQPLDTETVSKLCGILNKCEVSWKELAEKLGMLTLAKLFQDSPSPCQTLLENYQLSGGPLEGLVDALQSLGLTDGAQFLRNRQPSEDKQSTDTKVDSGFVSQEVDTPVVAND
ncbi:nuclear factor NF-kappa-B p100 subunit isoform X1 [Tachysurus vachellii]|uniref:nuclear factor NF-kappa-B p100 subunit isoform X1 n=1 Tax=Tachysurus vachellii TaxID=175792 RepID=UPI00296B3374|nr:nuclear factor NF-kappa-B p100 subunit isoform X1 [Tachysurus vachellii]